MVLRSKFNMKVKETRGEGRIWADSRDVNVGPGARYDRPAKSPCHFRHSVPMLQNLVTLTA